MPLADSSAGNTRLGTNHQNLRSMTVTVSWFIVYLATILVGELSP